VRIPTHELNTLLREAFEARPPPGYKGRRLSLKFATQANSETPTVVLFVNDPELLHFSYRRYLENRLRERFGLAGNPLRIVLKPSNEDRPARPRRR
jgi:GTP-binding protein